MAAPRKYGEDVRQAIHELVNVEGRAATTIAPILAEQFDAIPPLERIREIAREEKAAAQPKIAEQPKAVQLERLLAGIVEATQAEISRVQADKPDDAPDRLLKLANTVKTIEPLLSSKPKADSQAKPTGLAAALTKFPVGNDNGNPEPNPNGAASAHTG